jgi:hypothetical protein
MPNATSTLTGNIIRWKSTDPSVRYFDVYRRADNVTADITTGDIVAKVGAGTNHYVDLCDNVPYWYWLKAVSWATRSSSFSNTITAEYSPIPILPPTTRVVTSSYTILPTDEILFVNTDGGAIEVDLPVGTEGRHCKIINCGSSGNAVTVDPDNAEKLYGAGAGVASVLSDGEIINIHFNVTEGWW